MEATLPVFLLESLGHTLCAFILLHFLQTCFTFITNLKMKRKLANVDERKGA